MEKIIITVDSCSDLNAELLKQHEIQVIPMSVVFGGEEKKDGVSCTPDDIYAYVDKTGQLPTTSAISEHDFIEFFKKLTKDGAKVIHCSLSDLLSTSFNNAVSASKKVKGVYVINTLELSMGIGICAMIASEQRKKGKTAEDIVKFVEEQKKHIKITFVIDTLKYLHKGGRCSALKRFLTMMLPIKPEIVVKDEGKMDTGKKYFGKISKVLEKYTEDVLEKNPNANKTFAFITHTAMSDPKIVKTIEKKLKDAGFKTIHETIAGSTITCHCGKNCLGVGVYNGEI